MKVLGPTKLHQFTNSEMKQAQINSVTNWIIEFDNIALKDVTLVEKRQILGMIMRLIEFTQHPILAIFVHKRFYVK